MPSVKPLASLALLFLAGCSTAPSGLQIVDTAKAALDATPVCCSDLSKAQHVPLPREAVEITIDQTNSQTFDFGGNKAFFKLYELPVFSQTYSILLSSFSAGARDDLALFIPRVAIYDADFHVTRFFDEKTLRNRGNDLERTIFFNPSNAKERYVAIFGSDLSSSVERAYSLVTVQTMAAGPVIFNLYSGKDGRSTLRSSPAGKVRIEVQGLPHPP